MKKINAVKMHPELNDSVAAKPVIWEKNTWLIAT